MMTPSQRAVEAALNAADYIPNLDNRKWMRAAIEAALAADGVALQAWQPAESAPKDGTEIIYLNKFGEIGFCYWSEAASQFDESLWYDDQADDECCPLYWLPRSHLPPPPAVGGEADNGRHDDLAPAVECTGKLCDDCPPTATARRGV